MIALFGEMILDIVEEQETLYYAGGAPYNVAKRYSHLGKKCYFCSTIGNDKEGLILKSDLINHPNITAFISQQEEYKSGVSKVSIDQNGERHFHFEENRAYELLNDENVDMLISECDLFHFASLPLTSKQGEEKTEKLMSFLNKQNKIVSFDVNLRPSLFASSAKLKETYLKILPLCDILKMSEDEAKILNISSSNLKKDCLLFITKGQEGAEVYYHDLHFSLPAIKCSCLNTLGAGDAFMAGVLYMYQECKNSLPNSLEQILTFAIANGSYAVSHPLNDYPSKEKLINFIFSNKNSI